jgi:hypothetical protein
MSPVKTGGAGTNQYKARGAARQQPAAIPSRPTPALLRQFQQTLRQRDLPPAKTPAQTQKVLRHEYPDLQFRSETLTDPDDPFGTAVVIQHKVTRQVRKVSWAPVAALVDRYGEGQILVEGLVRRGNEPATAVIAQIDNPKSNARAGQAGRVRIYDNLAQALRAGADVLRTRGADAYIAQKWPGLSTLRPHGYKPVVMGLGEGDTGSTDDFSYAEKQFPNGWTVRAVGGAKISGPDTEVVGFSLHDPAGRQIAIPRELLPPGTHLEWYRGYEETYTPSFMVNTYTMDPGLTDQLRRWVEAYAGKAASTRRRA